MANAEGLALVGSESLIGREIRDVLSGNALGQNLKLVAAGDEEVGLLTHQGGEPAVVGALVPPAPASAAVGATAHAHRSATATASSVLFASVRFISSCAPTG